MYRRPYLSELLDATMCAKITVVLRHDYPGLDCSVAKALEVIGERWSLLIVRTVMHGNRRFGEMQESLGIARNVLSARLQRLVDEDILERRAYQESPPRYEYFLTEKGLDLWPALIALLHWGDRYSPPPNGPTRVIVHKECGGRVSERGICESCGQLLHARDAKQIAGPGAGDGEPAEWPLTAPAAR
jgi:DNA-binding HxlR family transcriptional regulator